MLEAYEADDLTPVQDLAITNYQAGQASDVVTVHLWNARDAPGSATVEPVLIVLRTEDPTRPGVYLASGVPPQDELWARARITGVNNQGDPSWTVAATDWRTLGASSGLLVDRIPPDCAVHLELRMEPPTSAQGGTPWRHRLVAIHSEYSQPVPPALTHLARGILHGVGDPSHTALVDGLQVTATNPASDLVTIAAGRWIHRGRLYGAVSQTVPCTQVDSAGAALQAGESYWLVLSVGTGLTVTKGDKDAAPTKPTPPAGESVLAFVRVDHDVGGMSIVEGVDVESTPTYDRFALTKDSSGLSGVIHAGRSIAGGTWRFRARPMPLVFPPDATSYVHQLASGLFEVTSERAPNSETTLGPLWEVTTDATQITAIVDHRRYAEASKVLRLRGPVALGAIAWLAIEEHATIERVILHASDNGGGTSGRTLIDVTRNGATIYPSSAIDDQRAELTFDAANLRAESGPPEVLDLVPGDRVAVEVVEVPTGGSPGEIEVVVILR